MIQSLYVENFRGFDRLDVGQLAKFNLIIGKNSVGKTALLEAVLAGGAVNPSALLSLDSVRGISFVDLKNLAAKDIFGAIFRDKSTSMVIRSAGARDTYEMVAQFAEAEVSILQRAGPDGSQDPIQPLALPLSNGGSLELQWRRFANGKLVADARCQGSTEGLVARVQVLEAQADQQGVMLSMRAGLTEADLKTVSALKESARLQPVVVGLRSLVPDLDNLEIAAHGSGHILKGVLAGGEYRPIGLLGEGVVRCLAMLLPAAQVDSGLLCIDDIDAGLHHGVLASCLKALRNLVATKDVQIFATTHSYECIQAAHAAFSDAPNDLAVFRLDRNADGIRVTRYDGETRAYAIKRGWEVR